MKNGGQLHIRFWIVLGAAILANVRTCAWAQSSPCPRFSPGSTVTQPDNLLSVNGALSLAFTYQTRTDLNGNILYCFTTESGSQSPTLHVRPGDSLKITLKNLLPPPPSSPTMAAMAGMTMAGPTSGVCGAPAMTASSINIHYHGTNTPPVCHQDEVIQTMVNSGETFDYDLQIPPDEPPGLYWYHPHVHGMSEAAVQGGASGALIVEGIENVNPAVAGLPQQVLIIRDNPVPGDVSPGGDVPEYDVSLNYIPIPSPTYPPAIIPMKPSEKQFWRVLNASADTIMDLQLTFDGVVQLLNVIALDGVPTGSQDGTHLGTSLTQTDILLAPAARAEFIVTGPAATVKEAILSTLSVNTGPYGFYDPARPLARIQPSVSAPEPPLTMAQVSGPPPAQRFAGLASAVPTTQRKLYFSENFANPENPCYFITVDGQKPVVFNPANPPAIVTTQGSVEDWTIENRSPENHEFHIHQIHFLLLEQNGVPVSTANAQFLDTIQVPYWTGSGPYPSVTLRMDFRGQITGNFVYHCHILDHEDKGMMAIIQVNPAPRASAP
jgi:FtsP/CotA-like multicopper oxidase with cupredoxin domain